MVHSKAIIKNSFRLLTYLGLFFVFCYFYMVDQMDDFIKGRRTVGSRFEEAKVLEPPTITICMDTPLKASVSNQYEFEHLYDLLFKNEPNLTTPDKFNLFGYVLNRDFEVQVTTKTCKKASMTWKERHTL